MHVKTRLFHILEVRS